MSHRAIRRASFSALLLGLSSALANTGCSSDAAPGSAAGGAAGAAAGAGGAAGSGGAANADPDAVVGSFIVDLVGATDNVEPYVSVSGKVYDGVTPSTVAWDLVSSAAGCQLLKVRAPFCSTPCTGGGVCVEDEQCAGYPAAQDLGPVVLQGLGSVDITMKPIASGYQLPGDVMPAFPPAAEGSALSLHVTGGPYGAFEIESRMIAPLVAKGPLTLDPDQPLSIAWTAPGDTTLARMQVKLDISHHGGAKGKIECDVADSGALVLPASLVSGLIALGVAGFPTATLTRVATGSASIAPGKVTLQASSSVSLELVVPGVLSCHDASECPTGKACRQDLTCAP